MKVTARKIKPRARVKPNEMQILNSIHRSILGAKSAEAIAQIVLEQLPNLLPYSFASILLYNPRRRTLEVLAGTMKRGTHFMPAFSIQVKELEGTGMAAASFLTGEPQVLSDRKAGRLPKAMRKALSGKGICGVLDVPLVAERERIGALYLYTATPTTPTVGDLETALLVAEILAVALRQAQLNKVVETSRVRLHALAHRQLELEENQRRKMARDLHDMVGQNLTALNINLYIIARQLPPDTQKAVLERLADSSRLVEQVVGRIRNLMADLRPSILDDLGLPPALRWYVSEFSKRTELPSRALVQEIQPRLPQDVETALFRIAQEALTNVVKHARAQHALVELQAQDGHVIMTITDDGAGFDFEAMRRDPTKTGVGLVDMRERAEAIGGKIWVECETGKGTRVKVQVPG